MDIRDRLRNAQKAPKTVADYQAEAAEEASFRETEAYKRQEWEAMQKLWQEKAKKENWAFERKPFVGALERQQQAELAKQREIAELKERLAQLEER